MHMLKKVALPDSLEELSEYSFGTSIQKINVPKNVKNIVFSQELQRNNLCV